MWKVFVGRLDSSVTKHQLEDEFGKYGFVKSVRFASAIICFDNEREAQTAIRELNNGRNGWSVRPAYDWDHRSPPPTHRRSPTYEPYNIRGSSNIVRCNGCGETGHLAHNCRNGSRRNRRSRTPPRHRRRSPARPARLRVDNLHPSVIERFVKDEFAVFGAISSVRIHRGRPAGHAFIHFNDERDAKDAIRQWNGRNGWKVGPLSR